MNAKVYMESPRQVEMPASKAVALELSEHELRIAHDSLVIFMHDVYVKMGPDDCDLSAHQKLAAKFWNARTELKEEGNAEKPEE